MSIDISFDSMWNKYKRAFVIIIKEFSLKVIFTDYLRQDIGVPSKFDTYH